MTKSRINHFGVFSGSGIGAAGMQDAKPAIPGLEGEMVCLGGIDVDAAGVADFYQFTGVRCTVRDMFSRTHILFLSVPCKGFSGLLSRAGESFQLSCTPIWVRPIVTALAVRGGEGGHD